LSCEAATPVPAPEPAAAKASEGLSQALESLACSNGSFVLLYATDTDQYDRIAALPSKPAFVVVDDHDLDYGPIDPSDRTHAPGYFHLNDDPEVARISVIKYIPTNYSMSKNFYNPNCPVLSDIPSSSCTNVTLDSSCTAVPIESRIAWAMDSGFDGVFFDETNSPASPDYVHDCALKVKAGYGESKLVIINPGASDPSIYPYYDRNVDIISVEHDVSSSVTGSGISAIHWMGVEDDQVNPQDGTHSLPSVDVALAHLSQFRNNGGFWYYGAPHYSQLPDDNWLQTITNAAQPGRPDCGCVAPSPQNLLQNPGFDGGLWAWNIDYAPGYSGYVVYSSENVTDCASSGSALFWGSSDGSGDVQRISQCVSVSPNTTYNFGAHIFGGSYAHCDVELYTGPGCNGYVSEAAREEWLATWWSPDERAQVMTAGDTASALVSCRSEGGGSAYFDTLYLTQAPGEF
jgi:hypothetical protein